MMSYNPKPVKVTEVNPHLLCVLCGGYYVDATTIIECLHSFCKSCIVKYLETNKYCPICDVQVHKTKPLLNIRSDRTLQAIVYKVVPGLLERELNCRKEFHKKQLQQRTNNGASQADDDEPFFSPEDSVLLAVQFSNPSTFKVESKRYLRCAAAVTIRHLQRLLRAKFSLSDRQQVEFLHNGTTLPPHLSLVDLSFMYSWKRKLPVELEYRLLECYQKRIKLSHEEMKPPLTQMKQMECETRPVERLSDKCDREVQLRISENGVMSVERLNTDNVTVGEPLVTPEPVVDDRQKQSEQPPQPAADIKPDTVEPVQTIDQPVKVDLEDSLSKDAKNNNILPKNKNCDKSTPMEVDVVEKKPTEISTNTPVKEEKPSEIKNKVGKINVNHTPNQSHNMLRMNFSNSSVTIQKVYPGAVKDPNSPKIFKPKEPKPDVIRRDAGTKIPPERQDLTKPTPSHIRYKTLKSPIKQWNPSIARDTVMAMKQAQLAEQERLEGKSVPKTPKFFKMRNVPRFLGNPASGVKPMYQATPTSEAPSSSSATQTSSSASQQMSKPNTYEDRVTVMKIDPKTLSPVPASLPAKSKLNPSAKVPSPFVPVSTSQKPLESPLLTGRTSIRNPVPVSKSGMMCMKPTSQNHSAPGLSNNPFLLPSPHLMYGGFPRPFSPLDSATSRMPTDSQILRAMSLLCPPSAAFHPSLPPSISMLFNPHNHSRTLNEKMNMKYPSMADFHKTPPVSTPSVQRIPPSGLVSKHSPVLPQSSSSPTTSSPSDTNKTHQKPSPIETPEILKESKQLTTSLPCESLKNKTSSPSSTICSDSETRLTDKERPLSNGFATAAEKSVAETENKSTAENSSKAEVDESQKSLIPTNSQVESMNEVNKAGQSDKSSVS